MLASVLLAGLTVGAAWGAVPPEGEALRFYHRYPRQQADSLARQFQLNEEDRRVFVRALRVWPLIRRYADQFQLDPMIAFRVAATESVFREEEVGASREIGLYQLLPSTGDLLWKWYGRSAPEPRKGWRASTPNQIYLAIRHLANIERERGDRKTSLREWKLTDLYAVYNGGPGGLAGKPKKNWVMANLRASKQWENVAYALDQVQIQWP